MKSKFRNSLNKFVAYSKPIILSLNAKEILLETGFIEMRTT